MIPRLLAAGFWLASTCLADTDEAASTAMYLANEGVLVTRGATSIVFDPLFRYPHNYYQAVPASIEAALFAGTPPFEELDAVFISHYHADHFSPSLVLDLLRQRTALRLYAPAQAVAGLRAAAAGDEGTVFERVYEVDLEYGDAPVTVDTPGLLIEAVRIPHTGWPQARQEVQNIAFRVTLDEAATVLHLGDADTRDRHFARDADHWARRPTDMAFPPYWYFLDSEGRSVLETRLRPGHSVGVHIPADPLERPAELAGFDVFTRPGETRVINSRD